MTKLYRIAPIATAGFVAGGLSLMTGLLAAHWLGLTVAFLTESKR
jgi:hypothetical protein